MFSRLFKKTNLSSKKANNNSLLRYSNPNRIDSILILDNNGLTLSSYHTQHNDNIPDSSLISMFISAISNFSKELFNRNDGASISVNHGEYIISLESNHRLCVAFIGKYDPNTIYKKISKLLITIDNLYDKYEEPSCLNYEQEIFAIIKKEFNNAYNSSAAGIPKIVSPV